MAGNIEDFLRRAIEQKLGRRAQDVEILPEADAQPDVRRVEPPALDVRHGSVADHVTQHMDTHEYEERASHLAEGLGQTDERMEEHLHDAFDHDSGPLQDDEAESADEAKKSTESTQMALLQLFRSKSALRNAIIVREVFDRPEHRW